MLFPARSNLLHGQGIASSGTERPSRTLPRSSYGNDISFLVKAVQELQKGLAISSRKQ